MEVTKAVILAAGRGTRMQSLTEERPKPLLPLAGRPILAHAITRMEQAGIRDVLLIIGYRGELIREYFSENPPARARVHCAVQKKQDGTGSAALLARDFTSGEPFLLTYGDILVDFGVYRRLIESFRGSEMALALKWVEDPCHGAAVYIEGDRVTRIVEKPPPGTSTTNWNNAGIFVFQPLIFERLENLSLSPRGEYELTDAIHAVVESGEAVHWIAIEGFWRDVGRPEDLPAAEGFVTGES